MKVIFLGQYKMEVMIEHIKINAYSTTPKYMQLDNSIIGAIKSGSLAKNDMLPSINDLCVSLDISRDSIVRAYNYLRSNKVIDAWQVRAFTYGSREIYQGFGWVFF